jgi:hypothetical protein
MIATGQANPIELELVKKAFYYLAGDDGEVKVGEIVDKIKSLWVQAGSPTTFSRKKAIKLADKLAHD